MKPLRMVPVLSACTDPVIMEARETAISRRQGVIVNAGGMEGDGCNPRETQRYDGGNEGQEETDGRPPQSTRRACAEKLT